MTFRADIVIAAESEDGKEDKNFRSGGSRTPAETPPKPGIMLKVSVRSKTLDGLKVKLDGILATVDED